MGRTAHLLLAGALGLLCARGQNAPSNAAVHAWQDTIQLPTYPENDPDPNPQFAIFGAENPNYPYPQRTNISRERRGSQAWRTLNLENQYLFCRVLPDLGGHLYNCRDKRNGREVFYANPVIKKDLVGLRGAWAATGIESNFPATHSRDSASPVDFAVETGPDGAGRAIVEDLDRVTGMEWRVEFLLRPGSTVLEQRVTFYNGGAVRRPYEWWSNAEVAFDDQRTRVVLPTHLVASHGTTTIRPWPVDSNGVDDSLVAGHKDKVAWFAYGSQEPFMAVYKPASRAGVAHFADPQIVPGKKVWYWGSESDEYVKQNLTDAFPSYIEIQAGLSQDQETFQFLGPEETKSFSELWIPVYDLGGVSRVSADAVVNLQRNGDGSSVLLEVSATHAIAGATIRVRRGAAAVFEARADLSPGANYSHTIQSPGPALLTLQVLDAHGSALVEYAEGQYSALTPAQAKIGQQPSTDWSDTKETEAFLSARAEFNELNSRWNFALGDARHGLALFPASAALEKESARLALEFDRPGEAQPLLSRVLAATPSDVEAAYLLGVADAMNGQDAEARLQLSHVPLNGKFGDAALLQFVYIAARAKDYAGALFLLRHLPALESSRPVHAGAVEVALLRRSGQADQAKKKLARWRAADPADTMLRIEAALLGADDPDLWTHLAKDSERVLNFAGEYLRLGMTEDALSLLAHSYPSIPKEQLEPGAVPPAASPLVAYYRAYCRSRLGRDPAADLRQAAAESTRYIFPFRSSSFAVLSEAIQHNPADATAHFLLGRLYLYRMMADDAMAEWRKARALKPPPAELNQDLNLLLTNLKNVPAPAPALAPAKSAPSRAPAAAARASLDLTETRPSSQPPRSPLEVATSALLRAGRGQPGEAAGMFDPKVFTAEKQPNEVRRAYIEVQLQNVLAQARSAPSLAALTSLDKLGGEDPNLPFTLDGFFSFMGEPHFQYFSSLVELACHDEKSSRKRWAKIAKMKAPLGSPEFVYPLLAAARLAPQEAMPKIEAALTALRDAMGQANGADRPALQFSEAMLQRATGGDAAATGELETLAHESSDSWVQYLGLVGLRETPDGKP